jgi:hypothetical protein
MHACLHADAGNAESTTQARLGGEGTPRAPVRGIALREGCALQAQLLLQQRQLVVTPY